MQARYSVILAWYVLTWACAASICSSVDALPSGIETRAGFSQAAAAKAKQPATATTDQHVSVLMTLPRWSSQNASPQYTSRPQTESLPAQANSARYLPLPSASEISSSQNWSAFMASPNKCPCA